MHTTLGTTMAFLAPLASGLALDLTGGGTTVLSWVACFLVLAAGVALGPLALWLLRAARARGDGTRSSSDANARQTAPVASRRPGGANPVAGRILLLYAAGLIASSFLGKIAPIGPPLGQDLGLTLAQLGWMISSITTVAAVLGAGVGVWLARLGARRALLLGLTIMAGAGMVTAVGQRCGSHDSRARR